MDLLDRMLGHDRWITRHLLDHCGDLPDDALDRAFDIGHRTLRETFDHLIFATDLWAALMTGQPPDLSPRPAARTTLDALIARHEAASDRIDAAARGVASDLDGIFLDHHGHRQSHGATILQVMHHNVQHRSEAMHMLQRLGVEVQTDGHPQEWEHLTGRIGDA